MFTDEHDSLFISLNKNIYLAWKGVKASFVLHVTELSASCTVSKHCYVAQQQFKTFFCF